MPNASAPAQEIRRFDIFAEWNRLKGVEKLKLHAGDARAYGLAVAKVVAGRKQRREAGKPEKEDQEKGKDKETQKAQDDRWWEHLGSDAEFKKVIVRRMGEDFYKDVFAPAVRKAWDGGKEHQDVRDTLRSPWNKKLPKPAKATSKRSA